MASTILAGRWSMGCLFRLPGDPYDPQAILSNCRLGRLSTDHAASSYGQPVVVGEDGTAYGPADLEDGVVQLSYDAEDGLSEEQWEQAVGIAKAAGFRNGAVI